MTLIAIAFNHVGAVGIELSLKVSFLCSLFTFRYLCKANGFFQNFL